MALEALAKMAFKKPKQTPSEEMQDELEPIDNEDWWGRHKGYIDHRKKYPYGKPPKIKGEKE